ncbi:unnamed protein product [Calypogeia fissa]
MVSTSSPSRMVIAGVLVLLLVSVSVEAQLVNNFYGKTCPGAESIVNGIVRSRVKSDRTMAASLLRLHFHDCFVIGCEGSVLLDSTPRNTAEKDAGPNKNSLRGFDVIDQIKSAVEGACPHVVSCSDIVALAARDAIATIGGPIWAVPTGRRDGSLSLASRAVADLPSPQSSFAQLTKTFAAVGLNQKDLVVLSAAHTIGRAHCASISARLYNFPGTSDGIDPTLNKAYAKQLRKSCPPGSTNLVNMDPSLGGQTFDTNYYANLFSNRGLFHSDEALLSDTTARGRVQAEINSPSTFNSDFAASMEKMGRIGVLTHSSPFQGEIRANCHRVNPKPTKKS